VLFALLRCTEIAKGSIDMTPVLRRKCTPENSRQTNQPRVTAQTARQAVAHCAVYEDELQRIWPLTEEDREKKIA
jgi:hypothetical protein